MIREERKKLEVKIEEAIHEERVYQRQPNTCVVLFLEGFDEDRIFGFTKVRYPDVWNPDLGIEIAREKALAWYAKDLAARLEVRLREEAAPEDDENICVTCEEVMAWMKAK